MGVVVAGRVPLSTVPVWLLGESGGAAPPAPRLTPDVDARFGRGFRVNTARYHYPLCVFPVPLVHDGAAAFVGALVLFFAAGAYATCRGLIRSS
jgi:hypothetical protein